MSEKDMYEFSWPSFWLGVVIGALIAIFIIWMCYLSRTFTFSNCPRQKRVCTSQDYLNDPSLALASGAKLEDVVFERDGQIYYKRIQKNSDCVPSVDQALHILEPQYCLFKTTNGKLFEAKSLSFGSNEYVTPNGIRVITSEDCQPISVKGLGKGVGIIQGDPVLKWDAGSQALL